VLQPVSVPVPQAHPIWGQVFDTHPGTHLWVLSSHIFPEGQFPHEIGLLQFVSVPVPQAHPICEQVFGLHWQSWFVQV
jgi:hypothetical protein